MQDKLKELKTHLARVHDLTRVAFTLTWDQETYMPPGGARIRADQIGMLRGLAHQFFIDDEVGALLEDLSAYLDELDYDSDEASIIRVSLHDYEKKARVPTHLMEQISRASALGRQAWKQARADNDFNHFEPYLSEMVDLQVQLAGAFGSPSGNPYDALLDYFEPDTSCETIDAIFSALKPPLVELVRAIAGNADAVDDGVLHQLYDHDTQLKFSAILAEAVGYDFQRGRLDLAAHPFTSGPGIDDMRITTRVHPEFLPSCLMATIHEAGHGIHRQQTSRTLYRTGLDGSGSGLAVAESQSRFYENVLGRSRPFWKHFFPRLQETFPRQLEGVDLETWYRALNRSKPSLIRVEADEVTYGLHIMLRFEIENELINGRMQVADLPAEWNARMEAYLGVVPPTDSDGVLQDIHWSQGGYGYFPDYLLGSIFASQLWDAMLREHPAIPGEVEAGQFGTVNAWLRERVQQHGRKFTLFEMAERAAGGPYTWEPYMSYLQTKYGEIYGL